MIYSFDYDMSYFPAIPVVEVEIRQMNDMPGVSLRAIVDSGADATIIPIQYLEQIQAHKGDKAWLRGTAQNRIRVELYWVWLHIGGHRPLYIEVVGDTQGEEAILGAMSLTS
jgi:predicted aspartyl protease